MSWRSRLAEANQRSKEWVEQFDATKKYPGYFKKGVFQAAFAVLAILFIVLAFEYGGGTHVYVSCPEDAFRGKCYNPFYGGLEYGGVVINECRAPSGHEVLCSKEFFLAGETYGKPPSNLDRYFLFIAAGVLGAAFLVNHLMFRWRSGRWSY